MRLPKIVRDGTNNGFFVHSRQPLVAERRHGQAAQPRRSPLVQRPVEGRRAAGQVARGGAASRSGSSPDSRSSWSPTEPLVKDPIAFDWGADGKLWVVEMGDYPLGIDGKGKPGGVVRFLEDTNGDGRYDKQTTFLDGLGFPTGVMPWRNGVLVACAPDIFYAEDRDGDGKADHREVLFTGFTEGNQQHRLNGFELGLDGWVYGANGDSGGKVRSLKTGKRSPISGRDFRFRPDTGEFEAESGQTQYGRHRDDWGHWFGNNNPNWAWHYVLADQDLRRNPHYAAPDPRQTLEPETRLYPLSRTLARFNDLGMANHVTSANSPTPYRDDLFGPWFATSLFVSEPVHNLVHRMVLEPDGVTLPRPSRAERVGPRVPGLERQLVPADDAQDRARRRPLDRRHVPRGHRASRVDSRRLGEAARPPRRQRAGADLSRLPGRQEAPADPAAGPARHGGPGRRARQPQRLAARHGPAAAAAPRRLRGRRAASRRWSLETKRPKTRVQAIWTLADLGGLDEPSALAGLTDPDPRVRESVDRGGRAAADASRRRSAEAVLRLADDPRAARPVSGRAGSGRLGRPSRRRGPGAAGAA